MTAPASAGRSGARLASLTSMDLHISVRIPVDSDLATETGMLRIALPAAGTEDRRATFTIRSGTPQQPGEEWFTAFREEAVARMPVTVEGFELLDRQDYVLSSFVDVTAVHYRRSLTDGERSETVSQVQAYLWATSYRMYVVDAATALARESVDLPVFDEMLRSLRLLPER